MTELEIILRIYRELISKIRSNGILVDMSIILPESWTIGLVKKSEEVMEERIGFRPRVYS